MVSAMVRSTTTVAVLAALALAPAHASASGGVAVSGSATVTTTPAAKPSGSGTTHSGGVSYGTPLAPPPPVAKQFSVSPHQLRADQTPQIVVRIDEARVHKVSLKISFFALRGNGQTLVISGGRHRTGHRIVLAWPK